MTPDLFSRSTRRLLLAACLAGAPALLAGCVGYSGHPEAKPVGDPTLSNPNVVSSKDVAATALTWVIKRYPPTGEDGRLTMWREFEDAKTGADGEAVPRLAVNVGDPAVRDWSYEEIVRRAGRGAVPLTPENESLPIYHVGRVWVEGDMATVDIFRPVVPWPEGPADQRVYQAITVRLRGGMKPWNVVSHRVWGIGTTPPPPLVYYTTSSEPSTPSRPQNSTPDPEAAPAPAPGHEGTPEKFDDVTPPRPAEPTAGGEPGGQ
jgi:hypothetical protein